MAQAINAIEDIPEVERIACELRLLAVPDQRVDRHIPVYVLPDEPKTYVLMTDGNIAKWAHAIVSGCLLVLYREVKRSLTALVVLETDPSIHGISKTSPPHDLRMKMDDLQHSKRRRITLGESTNIENPNVASAEQTRANALAGSFPNQKEALARFAEHSAEHFPQIQARMQAAVVLRSEENASFFNALTDDMRWEWLKNELS